MFLRSLDTIHSPTESAFVLCSLRWNVPKSQGFRNITLAWSIQPFLSDLVYKTPMFCVLLVKKFMQGLKFDNLEIFVCREKKPGLFGHRGYSRNTTLFLDHGCDSLIFLWHIDHRTNPRIGWSKKRPKRCNWPKTVRVFFVQLRQRQQ